MALNYLQMVVSNIEHFIKLVEENYKRNIFLETSMKFQVPKKRTKIKINGER